VNNPDDTGTIAVANPSPVIETPQAPKPLLDPNNPPWGVLAAVLTWMSSVLLLFIVPQLCALPYIASHYRGMGPTRDALLSDKTLILILLIGILPAHVITLLIAGAVVTRLGKISPTKILGLSWKNHAEVWTSVALAIALFGITAVVLWKFGGQDTDLERILRSSRGAALTMAFMASVTAPLVEEVIYRGLLYSALQRLTGPVLGVMIVTFMFAGLHVLQYWPNFGAISAISLLSLALTIVRARTGRLLPCYIIHLVFNGIQSVLIVVEPYLPYFFKTEPRQTVTSIVHAIIIHTF
jgi:membrane protease YdiL (CAAX protease family)